MSEARIHPPSEQRLSEARRAGHVPRAPLLGLFALTTGLSIGLFAVGPKLHAALSELYRAPLARFERGETPSFADYAPLLERAALLTGLSLALGFVLLALGTQLAQGSAVGFGQPRFALPRLAQGRAARLLFVLGLPLVLGSLLSRLFRAEPSDVADLLAASGLRVCGFLALCALLDVSLARASHLRSLWLTRREQRDEQREAYGSPELRKARDQARRELGVS